MDGIDSGFQKDARVFFFIPVLILVASILIFGPVDAFLVYIMIEHGAGPLSFYIGFVFINIFFAAAMLFARYKWILWLKLRKALISATSLLNTVTPEPIQVMSWMLYNEKNWYIGIQSVDAQPESQKQISRVEIPFRRVPIEIPMPAEIYRHENVSVIRLQDNKLILLATELNAIEKLSECPLSPAPRRIPLFIQFQIISSCGFGIFAILLTMSFLLKDLTKIYPVTHSGSVLISGFFTLLFFLFTVIATITGYITLKNLKNATLGWAIAIKTISAIKKKGLFQSVHLQIRDQQGNKFTQEVKTINISLWPTFMEIPVLFDPTGKKEPQPVNNILFFCRINEKGDITFKLEAVIITIGYVLLILLCYGAFFSKVINHFIVM